MHVATTTGKQTYFAVILACNAYASAAMIAMACKHILCDSLDLKGCKQKMNCPSIFKGLGTRLRVEAAEINMQHRLEDKACHDQCSAMTCDAGPCPMQLFEDNDTHWKAPVCADL